MVCSWKGEFYVVFDHNFLFVLHLPHSRFTSTHHVQSIIEEVDSDVEVDVDLDAMVVQVYDHPPLTEYVCLVDVELLKMKEALAQDLESRA